MTTTTKTTLDPEVLALYHKYIETQGRETDDLIREVIEHDADNDRLRLNLNLKAFEFLEAIDNCEVLYAARKAGFLLGFAAAQRWGGVR